MEKIDLSRYDNSWYDPGRGAFLRSLWFIINALFFINALNPSSGIKLFFLRLFGAKLGKNVVIKPGVNIKYPWNIEIGDYTWIGERVWIDSLGSVKIGANCCLSQGSMILNGNHDYTSPTFDLQVKPIILEHGVWIGAHAVVTPGTLCGSHSVLSVNSVASKTLEPYGIYRGNPAIKVRERSIAE
ncbi:WcaF family extracellular polysaccharide biosynthesis acetyltransferase [Alkalitalea saponilacus]|uniref:Putative colanic acid biosynthesis acetyltransferase WcaF n=1 Tax=Alkalitalea saponilacus TaxID=889453 RepID=A0A1T5CZK5_9BACT|nr:WcaF family extracellular polysaccharide biosynthesis acetyltransferase [Alkalitalea saponilacus]ASB50539.1 colanic acid biosynthesis acetyltransferase WcaF [Alkalitalea saponilacus]SKB64912.1 putative colanic acid biosynthesis acetyltransferase WcaF [Alkalitalea saponilacus]